MRKLSLNFLLLICLLQPVTAQIDSAALQQWRNLKYSMFIHWGIYSQLGGVWEGKQISRGLSEQIQAHAGIYSDVYANVAKQFNPEKWNADSIAVLAKQAGMGSVVITSKHHDGFAMFNSAYTDFDVVDATPFKRDVIKELADACKKHGLKFGLYFSLIDWHYPQASPISSHNSDYITPEHHQFNKQQVTELLTNYGPISELWFDMGSQSVAQSSEMRELVHTLQPNCMVASRIGNDMGDFTVMGDNQEPDYIIGVPWQSPASFFDETWGYRSWQKRVPVEEKIKEKLTSLIRVVSRGGNYLLNIGPRGDGSVVEYEKEVLLKIGDWLKKNSEAIYKTEPDPFHVAFEWGSVTRSKNKLCLHVLAKPKNGIINLPGLTGNISKVFVLDNNIPCKYKKTANDVVIELPASFNVTDEFKVIVLEFNGDYKVKPANILSVKPDGISLNTHNAFKYYSNSGIDYNTRFTSIIQEAWTLHPSISGTYLPQLYYTDEEKGKTIELTLDGKTQFINLNNDENISLNNNSTQLTWGPMYLQGPFDAGIEGAHDKTGDVDVSKSWTKYKKPWMKEPWTNGKTYTLPADRRYAYYVLQEIESPQAQQLLLGITSGDALLVFVNGEQKLIKLNSFKKDSLQTVLLIDLKAGKNQILIKLVNNFQKQLFFSISNDLPQNIYRKQLTPVVFKKNVYFPISWKLHKPFTPHQHMGTANMSLQLSPASK